MARASCLSEEMPHHVLADERRLYYDARGEVGPTLVLLNGMSQSTANWLSHARPLSDHFALISYDARGQGRSDLGEGAITLDGHVDDLHELLESLDRDTVTLCGFSHGARIALRYSALYPESVDRLVLTSAGDGDDALRRTIVRSWRELLRLGGLEAMAWAAIPDILGRDFLSGSEKHLDAMVRATLQRNTAAGLSALLDGMSSFPEPLADAPNIQAPTLLITSDADLLVSPRSSRSLAEALAAEHVLIDACGHTIPVERAAEWRALVIEFASA
ncbi:MAG: pimeloyl-ACP methyl ester carboxylesterase [Bradymonadia bacterium]|jgi:pimeloyl-ACP methyl ester carboxylesterase